MTSAGISAAETLVVGDAERDLEAAKRAGVAAALVRTGKGANAEALVSEFRVPVYDNLQALARAILEDTFCVPVPVERS
jgi:phosphoglycolate phosphatase-like HAD superfamily hydrolase